MPIFEGKPHQAVDITSNYESGWIGGVYKSNIQMKS